MSDNIIDFNKRKREQMEGQPMSEVSMDTLMQELTSMPRNDLMASVGQAVQEKMTRLLILTDIASKASDMLSGFGFDPDNFYLDYESLNRYLSGEMNDGEDALWNGPFFDWDADDEDDTTVRVVTTMCTADDDGDDVAVHLALEIMKLGMDDETWWRFNDGEWVHDGPPADIFDHLEMLDEFANDWEDEDGEDDEDDWYDDDDENSIYMYDFGPTALKALTLAGIDTVDQLKALPESKLAAIPGIDAKNLYRIQRVLAMMDADQPF